LDDVFRDHSRLIYRTAYSVTACPEDAEDVVQALFLQLWRRGLPSGFARNPRGYLYRAAINLALNVVRARRRQPSALDPAALQLVADSRAESAGSLLQSEVHEHLAAAMAQLNRRAVEMLVLRYTEDYSDAEIAKLLGTSRGVVAVTLFRARARLRKLLRNASGDGA
jgi:RNA polymerase sigma-70 factor (ECF subfamily)